jgi:hypothetical protein
MNPSVTLPEVIVQKILLIRGQKVILDADLAILYEVSTSRLNEQVRRNPGRFPSDFMFQLTKEEYEALRSQFATLEKGRGRHRKYLPYAFTEQGVAMLSSVLNSERAIMACCSSSLSHPSLRSAPHMTSHCEESCASHDDAAIFFT